MIGWLILVAYVVMIPVSQRMMATWQFRYSEAEFPSLYSDEEYRAKRWREDSGISWLFALVWPIALPETALLTGKFKRQTKPLRSLRDRLAGDPPPPPGMAKWCPHGGKCVFGCCKGACQREGQQF